MFLRTLNLVLYFYFMFSFVFVSSWMNSVSSLWFCVFVLFSLCPEAFQFHLILIVNSCYYFLSYQSHAGIIADSYILKLFPMFSCSIFRALHLDPFWVDFCAGQRVLVPIFWVVTFPGTWLVRGCNFLKVCFWRPYQESDGCSCVGLCLGQLLCFFCLHVCLWLSSTFLTMACGGLKPGIVWYLQPCFKVPMLP